VAQKSKGPREEWTYRWMRRTKAKDSARQLKVHVSRTKGWRMTDDRKRYY